MVSPIGMIVKSTGKSLLMKQCLCHLLLWQRHIFKVTIGRHITLYQNEQLHPDVTLLGIVSLLTSAVIFERLIIWMPKAGRVLFSRSFQLFNNIDSIICRNCETKAFYRGSSICSNLLDVIPITCP